MLYLTIKKCIYRKSQTYFVDSDSAGRVQFRPIQSFERFTFKLKMVTKLWLW